MRIAVLMTCHNRVRTTLQCLERLACNVANQNQHLLDVFVVDDGSTDGTGERIAEFGKKNRAIMQCQIIQGDGTLFWAKGMALAWETAAKDDYDYYLWLNDDVMLYPGAVQRVLNDYVKCRGVVVGACCEADEKTVSYGATDAKDRKIIPNGDLQKADGWLNGNFVLVSREVYQNVGVISNEYSHARADYEYAERLKKCGISFYSSSEFVGECHYEFDVKMRGKTLWQRMRLLWQPGYWNLHDLWLIRSRYHGRILALISCLHLIVIAARYKSE